MAEIVDVLDNSWPIEWRLREVKTNKPYVYTGTYALWRISSIYGYDYENASCAVSAILDSGGAVEFTTKNIGVTQHDLGVLINIRCTAGSSTYWIMLSVIEKPGVIGSTPFAETGTYCAFLNDNLQSIEFTDADVQFALTSPTLGTGYEAEPEYEPISLELKSWMLGFILGLAGKPIPQTSIPDIGRYHDTLYIKKATAKQTANILEVT